MSLINEVKAWLSKPDKQILRTFDEDAKAVLDLILNALGGTSATKTIHVNGTVGTSNIKVPSVAAGKIASVLIKNEESNPEGAIIGVSFDGGSNYFDILINENFTIDIASTPTQIDLIGSEANLAFQIVMNTE